MVMADLSRALTIHCRMDWMAVSSYGSGSKSSGVVRILKDLSTDVTGLEVLLVEDIIDTGLTLSYLVSNLRSRGPASLNVLTVFRKPEAARNPVDIAYVGFDIPNEFVVGYGLDYDGLYRNLTSVGALSPGLPRSRRKPTFTWVAVAPHWLQRMQTAGNPRARRFPTGGEGAPPQI